MHIIVLCYVLVLAHYQNKLHPDNKHYHMYKIGTNHFKLNFIIKFNYHLF